MAIAHKQNGQLQRTKYRCDICSKVDFWEDGWQWYGSYKELEDGEVFHLCSETCRTQFTPPRQASKKSVT